jgi:arabinan endo-1,5-alpha-L-arabinosidase
MTAARAVLSVVLVSSTLLAPLACSSDDTPATPGTGETGGATMTGGGPNTGGTSESGNSGGQIQASGGTAAPNTGGATSTGGTTNSGGAPANTGGASGSTGGSSAATGGNTSSGGMSASGGASNGGAGTGGTGSGGAPATYPTRRTDHLDIGAHDPAMIHTAKSYALFATGGLLGIRSGTDVFRYTNAGAVYKTMPGWITTALGQTIDGLWAPDVSVWNGAYHVYYAGSVFGSNHSVIGLATNTTLDQGDAAYKWVDQGLVIESNKTGGAKDDWNAIDPNVAFDESGAPWLVFGSFWSGIKLRKLDPQTGKPSASDATLYALANYSKGIEAPSIVRHGNYFYLFVSFDKCCDGVNSTYRTMVGRATKITGPYADDQGRAMTSGNAVQLLASKGRFIGPGGGTAFTDGSLYYYVHHYYDGQANGKAELSLRPMHFDANDWPVVEDPLWQ